MGIGIGAQLLSCRGTGKAQAAAGRRCWTGVIGWSGFEMAGLVLWIAATWRLEGAEATNVPARRPLSEPAITTNVLAGFRIEPGFRLELVASEPMIAAPVAMAFDENGRLFVVELPGQADRRAGNLGRVRVLDHMNEQGVFQNSTIYSDSLAWPSAVACYAGGIFVATTPDMVYLKDTKGDGVADARQVVLSGFGTTHIPQPGRFPNNFNWGPDNRIHGSSGGIGGEISSRASGGPVSLEGADFSFDPRTLEFFAETGPSQSGLTFDSHGRKFVSDLARPLLTPMYALRYPARNPYLPKPPGLAVVADPTAPVHRLVPEAGPAEGLNQRTNLVAPMTMARGCVVYRGRAFPTNYFDNAFVADPAAHLIHRLVPRENGLEVSAQRAPEEKSTEFLVSSDPAFRQVQIINGPDGALYVADARADGVQGRIWRVLPANVKTAKAPQLGRVRTYDLVSLLAQGDGWHRDTAARLLYERKDPAAPALLRAALSGSRLAQARVLALEGLAGAGALTPPDVLKALRDPDLHVRREALRVAERLLGNGGASDELVTQFGVMTDDPSLRVRYQLAYTLGAVQARQRSVILGRVLARDLANPWMRTAALCSSGGLAGDYFSVLAGNLQVQNVPGGLDLLQQLALMIGVSGQLDAVSEAANFIAQAGLNPAVAYVLLAQLGEGLYRTRSALSLVDNQGALQPFFSAALNVATDPTQPEDVRLSTTRLLGVSPLGAGAVGNWLLILCSPPTTPAVQVAAVETLSRTDDPQIVHGCLDIWPLLVPAARTRALTALLSREGRVPIVLDAIQNGVISPFDMSSAQKNFLRTYPMVALRQRAVQLLGPLPVSRPAVVERFKPALTLPGAMDRGRQIFLQRCISCHGTPGEPPGASLGPSLLRARTLTRPELMSKIIEPNVSVRPDYPTQVVVTKEGENMVGIVSDENRWTLSLAQVDKDKLVWPQLNISAILPQSWSLMPDGLDQGMAAQDMADLMEYVQKGSN